MMLTVPGGMRVLVVGSGLLAVTAGAAFAQGWERRFPAASPVGRGGGSMVYDAARGGSVMFGGANSAAVLGDTWTWDGASWQQRTPTHSPAGRNHPVMVWQLASRTALLFSGHDGVGAPNDTWTWDGTDWTQLAPLHAPSGRWQSGLAHDPRRNVTVLYGGIMSQQYADLGDTWEWDGQDWIQKYPVHSPGLRARHVMFYDAVRARVVLHGGNDQPFNLVNDTWEWDGVDWTQIVTPNAPPPRFSAAVAYDTQRSRAVVFGGGGYGALDDTWEWDGATWWPVVTPIRPSARAYEMMAYDAARSRAVMFGGFQNADTWEYQGLPLVGYRTFGQGCAGTFGTPFMDSDGKAPWLGEPFTVFVGNLPPEHSALVWLGQSRTSCGGIPLPFDLTPIGMTGCSLLVSVDAFLPLFNWGGAGACTLRIPRDPALVGGRFFNQALVLDQRANPLGAVVSNGAEGVIGAR